MAALLGSGTTVGWGGRGRRALRPAGADHAEVSGAPAAETAPAVEAPNRRLSQAWWWARRRQPEAVEVTKPVADGARVPARDYGKEVP